MKNKLLNVIVLMCTSICVQVQAQSINRPLLEVKPVFGYQREYLDWSISGKADGTSPNILSELIWKHIAMAKVGVELNSFLYKGLYLKGQIFNMEVLNGFANDSDYSFDNRERNEYDYRQDFKSNKGDVLQYQYQIGYQYGISKHLNFAGEVGRMYKSQTFYMFNFNPPIIQDVEFQQRSSYQTFWRGWVGAVALQYMQSKWSVRFRQNYQQLNYNANANWVLITDFEHPVSFTHRAEANGWVSDLEFNYSIYPKIQLVCTAQFGWMNTAKGIDQLNRVVGVKAYTRLNGVNSKYYAAQVGLNFQLK